MEAVSKPKVSVQAGPLVSTARYDWTVALLSLWMIAGVHLDAWAHHRFALETFFSPWHGVLYSGFAAAAAALFFPFIRNLARGQSWKTALPAGYGLSLLGAALFMAGGAGDMLWHTILGIEVGLEALLSPTHLLLAAGGALISTGPLRAAMSRAGEQAPGLPALISLALLHSILAFFTAYANPLIDAGEIGFGFSGQALTIASILLQTALLAGVMLFAIRRWRLPFGSLSLVAALTTLLAVSIHGNLEMLAVGFLPGLAADVFLYTFRPAAGAPGGLRWLAVLIPVLYALLFFATLALDGGLRWSAPMWSGTIVLAGAGGYLLSYAFIPPPE